MAGGFIILSSNGIECCAEKTSLPFILLWHFSAVVSQQNERLIATFATKWTKEGKKVMKMTGCNVRRRHSGDCRSVFIPFSPTQVTFVFMNMQAEMGECSNDFLCDCGLLVFAWPTHTPTKSSTDLPALLNYWWHCSEAETSAAWKHLWNISKWDSRFHLGAIYKHRPSENLVQESLD